MSEARSDEELLRIAAAVDDFPVPLRTSEDHHRYFDANEDFKAAFPGHVCRELVERLILAEAALVETLDCCNHDWLDSVIAWRRAREDMQ